RAPKIFRPSAPSCEQNSGGRRVGFHVLLDPSGLVFVGGERKRGSGTDVVAATRTRGSRPAQSSNATRIFRENLPAFRLPVKEKSDHVQVIAGARRGQHLRSAGHGSSGFLGGLQHSIVRNLRARYPPGGVTDDLEKTPLHSEHQRLGARLVPFAGYAMPIQYAGIAAEHHAVRQRAGLFDVSHMGELELTGPGALELVNQLVTNDLSRVADGRAMYTCCCNERGTILDDLIVYRFGPERVLVVCNA